MVKLIKLCKKVRKKITIITWEIAGNQCIRFLEYLVGLEESDLDSMKIDFKMSFVCEVYLFCLAWFFEIHGLEIEIMSFLF